MFEYYLHLGISLSLAGYGFWGIFWNIVKARKIEDTPTSKIRSASQGYVELSGFAKSLEENTLIAPLTGVPCLWYDYKIERHTRSGKKSRWSTVEKAISDAHFVLDDSTGECVIDPGRADVNTHRSQVWYGSSKYPAGSGKSALGMGGVLFGGRYRYTERLIHSDDYLYALGLFQSIHTPSAEQEAEVKAGEILSVWKQDYDALIARFDSDDDGEIDMQEWEQARVEAASEAYSYVLDNYDDTPINILARPPSKRTPFIISNQDPKDLVKKYRWRAVGMLVIFFASGAFAVNLLQRLF